MKLNDIVSQNNIEVGLITFLTEEAAFVTFHVGDKTPIRFHKTTYKGFLKAMGNISQYDKITDFTVTP